MKRPSLIHIPHLAFAVVIASLAAFGQTTAVSVTIGPEASLTVNTGTTSLTSSGIFAAFTGTTTLTYKVRTSQSTGNGSVVLKITGDFSPSGGPSVGSPPTAGDALTYTCTVSSPGTACVGTLTSSTSSTTNVGTFGADAHSASAGNSASVSWSLTNDPLYKTGSYSATATFTISAS